MPRLFLMTLLVVLFSSVPTTSSAGLVSALAAGAKKATVLSELAAKKLSDFDGPVYWTAVSARVSAKTARCVDEGRSESLCKQWGHETEQCIKTHYPVTASYDSVVHDPKLAQATKECDRSFPGSEDMAVLPNSNLDDEISWVTTSDRLAGALVRCSKLGVSEGRCSEWHDKLKRCLQINYPGGAIDWQSSITDKLITRVIFHCDRPLPGS